MPDVSAPGVLAGWRFVLAAFLAMLLPLALCAAGAIICGPAPLGQVAGALGGFAMGAIAAWMLSRRIRQPAPAEGCNRDPADLLGSIDVQRGIDNDVN